MKGFRESHPILVASRFHCALVLGESSNNLLSQTSSTPGVAPRVSPVDTVDILSLPAIANMEDILRLLQLLCETHNDMLQVSRPQLGVGGGGVRGVKGVGQMGLE